MANVLNIKINIPMSEEGPGYGGAILSMIASNEYKTIDECIEKFFEVKEVIEPQQHLVQLYQTKYETFKKIYPAVKQLYKDIKENVD